MAIPPVFSDLAQKSGKQILLVPLKSNKRAEILFNNNAMDAFILEGDKIVGGGGFRTGNPAKFAQDTKKLFNQLGKLGADMPKLIGEYCRLILRNVK